MTKPRPYGHYFILEKIAQGGMAEIFKGLTYDFTGLKKFIVIKRILPHIAANEDFIRMLVDEAKIAVHLNHGNIAHTYDLGKVAEDYFIVMEYVPGRTLSQIFKKSSSLKQPLSIPAVTYILSEVCNGLDYIHRRSDEEGHSLSIVHCDISPQNIIVSESGTVKIVDFGVAKAAFKLTEKERGVLKGKFAYMSPEQTLGLQVDASSDIFSTGVVLWELLTGRRLFKRKANSDTIEAVQTMTVYPPSAYRNEIPSELDEIVMKALERDPLNRYQSASDMSLALTKFNLKHFPEFKLSEIGQLLQELFQEEENTADLYQERTQHEELTVRDGAHPVAETEGSHTPAEDTLIVDPQELDFRSLFDEIEMEDVSEVTRAIAMGEDKSASPEDPEDETTGDLVEEEVMDVGDILENTPEAPLGLNLKKKALIAGGFILAALILFFLYHWFFSDSPGKLVLKVSPAGTHIRQIGTANYGQDQLTVKGLSPRKAHRFLIEKAGYQPKMLEFRVWPNWSHQVQVTLNKKQTGVLEIQSEPPGATIFLDGRATPQLTPAIFELEELTFPLVIGLSHGGSPIWWKKIDSADHQNLKIFADLRKKAGVLTEKNDLQI